MLIGPRLRNERHDYVMRHPTEIFVHYREILKNLNFDKQISQSMGKANQILGLIKIFFFLHF